MSLHRILCALALASAALACGAATSSSTETGDGGTDAATTDARTDGPSDAGGDLFPADATKVVVTEKGGFGPGPLDGSTCTPADVTFTLLLGTRDLSWKVCDFDDAGTYAYRAGQRILSEAELGTVTTKLRALRVNTEHACGADKPADQIVITTPSGSVTYDDSFYGCNKGDGKIYVDGIDDVLGALSALAK
jgi:hypothetical protein